MIFPLVSLIFNSFFWGIFAFAPRAHRFHAQADNAPLLRTYNARACYGVVQCLPVESPTIYRRNLRREKNHRLVSVHTSIDYTFGKKISAEACSGKEIYSGFTEDDDDDDDDTKILKSRRSGFSRGILEADRNELGLCAARYEFKSCC